MPNQPTKTMTIEMLPASYGDSFLIQCRGTENHYNILVDAGPSCSYPNVKARLLKLAEAGEKLDLLIVTHVDTDHIEGCIALITENGPAANPAIIAIDEVWHNSYRHLPLSSGRPPTIEEKRAVISDLHAPLQRNPGNDIGAREGMTLGSLLTRNNYNWNSLFLGEAVSAGNQVKLGDVEFRILAPTSDGLKGLLSVWKRELLKLGLPHDAIDSKDLEAAFEAKLMGLPEDCLSEESDIGFSSGISIPRDQEYRDDQSKTNASSIVFHLKFGDHLSALFLGDANGNFLEETLEQAGTIEKLVVNAVKVSHHGSKANTSPQLLRKVTSKHFLISSDGSKHKHPHIESVLRILNSQPDCHLVFNYPTATSETLAASTFKEMFRFDMTVGNSTEPVIIQFSESQHAE